MIRKIGIIGCGAISSMHLDAIHEIEEVDLVMVCDLNEDLVKKVAQANKCQWTLDYKELLGREDIEVVHILTPHYLHVPMAIETLKANKYVVLEKPVGISVDQLKALKIAEENSQKTVSVTLQNRFNPTTVKAKEIIDQGILGAFKGAKGFVTWNRKDGYYKNSSWRGQLAYEGGGLLINQAIHTLDLLEYVGGKVDKLKASVMNTTHAYIEVEDAAMITLFYEDGMFGHFYGTTSYGEDSTVEMEFLYEKGKLVFDHQQLYMTIDDKTQCLTNDIPKEGDKSYWGMSHQFIIKDIYQAINSKTTSRVTLEQAIKATELVLGSYESSQSKKAYIFSEGEL